jgi:hypothetical protein
MFVTNLSFLNLLIRIFLVSNRSLFYEKKS